jgi:hypothetical protein
MSKKHRTPLADRIRRAADEALADHDYVSAIDVLVGIRWLEPSALQQWQRGQIDCLESAIQTNPTRVAEAIGLLRQWGAEKGLSANEAHYVARTVQRQPLRFSESGSPALELVYRTHWVSPTLSERKRERLEQKINRAPELVVVQPVDTVWKCHRCGGTGGLLMMENPGPACLRCVGLDDLEFLPAGDALLTRRVRAKSARSAVVVRFSRARRRYERQGLLVEPQALADIEHDLADHAHK